MLLEQESYARVIHECSTVLACKGAACDPVSSEPFPYTLATCTWLCPADCIQETLRQKKGRTSHFTLEEVGWFSDMSASRLPEYVTGREQGQWKGDWRCCKYLLPQCHMSWDRPMLLGQESYARVIHECSTQYLLEKVQSVIRFQASLSHIHLQPARGCALQIASKKLFGKRKEGFLTSHLKKLGGSLTCHDMSASRLPEYYSQVVSTANGKVNGNITRIFCHSVTCLGTDQCCWDRNHMLG